MSQVKETIKKLQNEYSLYIKHKIQLEESITQVSETYYKNTNYKHSISNLGSILDELKVIYANEILNKEDK